ncbi:MAG: LamG-like jellyroll fold domain-containing protein [Pirellulaceae bacterium]
MARDDHASNGSPLQDDEREELFALADEILQGTADLPQQARLMFLLHQSAEFRRAYLHYMMLHAELSLTDEALATQSHPTDENSPLNLDSANFTAIPSASPSGVQPSQSAAWIAPFIGTIAAILILTVGIVLWKSPRPVALPPPPRGLAPERIGEIADGHVNSYYDHREMPIAFVATLRDEAEGSSQSPVSSGIRLGATTVRQESGKTRWAFDSGADVHILGPTMFGLESKATGVLFSGTVNARLPNPESKFSVQTPSVRVVDLGTEFRVRLTDRGDTEVRVIEGEVEVQTMIRLPRYYWNFDAPNDSRDLVVGERLHLGKSVNHVPGLIGEGALEFDNTREAYVEVEGGLGDEVGSGGFAVTHGVTIEAIIVSRWNGKWKDYDEIFRKEDGDYRMLLSFQHDDFDYAIPPVSPAPCLSFGLHLEGLGYSELDMPLDGKEGRPTRKELTDGQPHHIVATYDCFTGHKALYIDGRLCFEHTFPKGTLILSGGPVPARIGNTHMPNHEPFHGIIDELAFYDFALSSDEIATHHARVSQGESYFDIPAEQLQAARWKRMLVVTEGESKLFSVLTGLPISDES